MLTKKQNIIFFIFFSRLLVCDCVRLLQCTAANNNNRLWNTLFSFVDKDLQDNFYYKYACFPAAIHSRVLAVCYVYETTTTISQQSHMTGKVKVFRDLSSSTYEDGDGSVARTAWGGMELPPRGWQSVCAQRSKRPRNTRAGASGPNEKWVPCMHIRL